MIPSQLRLERPDGKQGKYSQCNDFLYHLELHDVKRAATIPEPQPVGGNLKTILKKSNCPAKGNHPQQRQGGKPTEFLTHL